MTRFRGFLVELFIVVTCLGLIANAMTRCASVGAPSVTTLYRSPERARTVLTATQTLRYHSAELVAKACVQSRVTPAQCEAYGKLDATFTSAWGKASELVQLWLVAKGSAPKGLQESMSEVETAVAKIEAESRGAQ